jgi:hypothetical protein
VMANRSTGRYFLVESSAFNKPTRGMTIQEKDDILGIFSGARRALRKRFDEMPHIVRKRSKSHGPFWLTENLKQSRFKSENYKWGSCIR